MSLELLLMTPVLTGLVLLVLWAADSGRVGLTATLAAEEAAVAAGETCIEAPPSDGPSDRRIDKSCAKAVVEQVVTARTPSEARCVGSAEINDDSTTQKDGQPVKVPVGGRVVTVDVNCEAGAPGLWGIASGADGADGAVRSAQGAHLPTVRFDTDGNEDCGEEECDGNAHRSFDHNECRSESDSNTNAQANYSETYPTGPGDPKPGSAQAASLFTYVEARPWNRPTVDADGNTEHIQGGDIDGNPVYVQKKLDTHGNPLYREKVDADGNSVADAADTPLYTEKTVAGDRRVQKLNADETPVTDGGSPVYVQLQDADGNSVTDADGNPVYVTELVPKLVQQALCLHLHYGQAGPPDNPVSAYLRGLGADHPVIVIKAWTQSPSTDAYKAGTKCEGDTDPSYEHAPGDTQYVQIPETGAVYLWLSPEHEQEHGEYLGLPGPVWNSHRTRFGLTTCSFRVHSEPDDGAFELHVEIVNGGSGTDGRGGKVRFICNKLGAAFCTTP